MCNIKLSKTLSWILRHGAKDVGISLDSNGFASVEHILRLPQLRNYSVEDIRNVVDQNDKKRFHLEKVGETLKIRANQGHTIPVENLLLKPITDPFLYPTVVHGSYVKFWDSIKKQGLSRMRRNHIHLASGLPKSGQVISGMRNSCDLLIYIDLSKAIDDGFQFFESENGVILSPGNTDGFLPSEYFSMVEQIERNGMKKVLY